MIRKKIETILLETERPGMDYLIDYMEDNGFFTAPCSGSHHLAKVGGLAEHSLNVYNVAMNLHNSLCFKEDSTESIAICALLHDIGKIGQYGKPNYVQNILKTGRVSDSKPYTTNPKLQYIDHEIRSIAIISKFIELTEDEQFAILYHNGMYGNLKYSLSGKETPLYLIIHFSDMWASRFLEV